MFDVALVTGLPATGRRVEFDGEDVSTKMGWMVRDQMTDIVVGKREKWKAKKGGR